MSLLNFLHLRKGYGVRKAYTLAELGNAYDLGLASSFKTAFEKLGGTVIANNFPVNRADFTSYINNVSAMRIALSLISRLRTPQPAPVPL